MPHKKNCLNLARTHDYLGHRYEYAFKTFLWLLNIKVCVCGTHPYTHTCICDLSFSPPTKCLQHCIDMPHWPVDCCGICQCVHNFFSKCVY